MAPKYSAFAEIDNRGLSALADAAASQSKRDSQNSSKATANQFDPLLFFCYRGLINSLIYLSASS